MRYTKKMFFRFLKEKGIYYIFFKNLHNCIKNKEKERNKLREINLIFQGNINLFIENCLDKYSPSSVIQEGFTWSYTKEGDNFWANICIELFKL